MIKFLIPLQEHPLLLSVSDGTVSLLQTQGDQCSEISYRVVTQRQFEDSMLVCRVLVALPLYLPAASCTKDQLDEELQSVTERVKHASAFLLDDSDIVLGGKGVISLGVGLIDGDQSISSIAELETTSRNAFKTIDALKFSWLVGPAPKSTTNAPMIEFLQNDKKIVQKMIHGEYTAYVSRSLPIREVGPILLQSLLNQIEVAKFWLSDAKSMKTSNAFELINVLPFKSGHLFSMLYPLNTPDSELVDYRKLIHEAFLLPINSPFISRNNCHIFSSDKVDYQLHNTHVGLKSPSSAGITSITKGIYSYHHYMQDNFNDNKWGCAYRSLQTIVSWFRHQGYSTKPVPTHKQIQQCLVTIGDKSSRFVDSREWIGSTEVGFVLESYLGVTSRFINVSSGDELGEKGRELLYHFSTQGTPIMIGGGVLAHTILGVNYDPQSGDIHYLVLDPHYTGTEDIVTIQKQGWCGWKGPKFWSSKAYYNLCLPQRPNLA